jgi:benzylsuccinate CoA-transferase BbsE subunit/naphthyl-2-methylsuccinate CoA transferase subunit
MSGPGAHNAAGLSQLRILDLTDETGVYGAKLLADIGVEVIRLEPPTGDPMRQLAPLSGEAGGWRSLYFEYMNTSKRSVVLDLESPQGLDSFRALARGSDAVMFAGPAARYDELDLDALIEGGAGPVVTSVTPFGLTGPFRSWLGKDLVAFAAGGVANSLGDPDRAPLSPAPICRLACVLAGQNAGIATLAALRTRRRGGRSQRVDVSLHESVVAVSAEMGVSGFLDDMVSRRRRGNRRLVAPSGHFPTLDGHAAVLALTPAAWDALAAWISERTDNDAVLASIFRGGSRARVGDLGDVVTVFTEDLTRQYTKQALFEEGQRRGVSVTPVNEPALVGADPQLAERDFWTELPFGEDQVRAPGAPYRHSRTPWTATRAPELGEHTEQVLAELTKEVPTDDAHR